MKIWRIFPVEAMNTLPRKLGLTEANFSLDMSDEEGNARFSRRGIRRQVLDSRKLPRMALMTRIDFPSF
jgi:hypothetical protein